MADTKVSALTELAVPPDAADEFLVVDKSDTTMAASGTDKRIKRQTLGSDTLYANWVPGGGKIETFPRFMLGSGGLVLASGTLYLVALPAPLKAGVTYSSITWVSGGAGITSATNQWFTLVDKASLQTLRTTTDNTSTAWSSSTARTLNLSSTYTPTANTDAYVGIMVAASTPPNLRTIAIQTNVASLAPILVGTSTTGMTGPPSDGTSVTALTSIGTAFYAYVS